MKHTFPCVLAACLLLCTGCTAKNTESRTEPSPTESTQSQTEAMQETESSAHTDITAESAISESVQEMDALVAICTAEGQSEELALDTASYLHEKAQELAGTVFGEITSEEDAIETGRDVLMLIGAGDSVERAESEYVEIDGALVKYERDGTPWHTEYYSEYDAWRVTPALPSGTTEDDRYIAAPGQPPYVILRGADGAVLGVFY